MTNNKLIVALLIVTILLSVMTIGVAVASHVSKNSNQVNPVNVRGSGSANVGLTILPNTNKEVPNETK